MTKDRTLQREQEHHKQAFEIYFGLGTKRSYKAVANQLGLSVSAVRLMAKSFDWSGKIEKRDAAIARQAADNVIGPALANATRNRKLVELALMKVIKAINSDKVRIQVGDLDRLLRLQAFLDGDGVLPTVEALLQRPFPEVLALFRDWMRELTDEQLQSIIDDEKQRVGASVAPPPPTRPILAEDANRAESAAGEPETA